MKDRTSNNTASSPVSWRYQSNYKDGMVSKSIKDYRQQVVDALHRIYHDPDATVRDFEKPLISKLLVEELVKPANISLLFFGREGAMSSTYLKLTKEGCSYIGKPFVPD